MKMGIAEWEPGSSISQYLGLSLTSPFTEEVSGREADDVSLHLCVSVGEDKRAAAAILSADATSPFSGMTLKEGSPLSFPPDTPRLLNNMDNGQIPKHSSIKTFWLLTRPPKMVDMCRL